MLNQEEVEKIAKLARIEFDSADIELMKKDLSSILDYIKKLEEIDIDKVEPTTHSISLKDVYRRDNPKDFSGDLISLSPQKEKRHIKTKPVF